MLNRCIGIHSNQLPSRIISCSHYLELANPMLSAHVDPAPFAHFGHFVAGQKQTHNGQDITGNTYAYIPQPVLEEYWTINRISKVLQAHIPTIPANIRVLKQRYIQIFSILVYIDGVRHLDKFTSQSLDDSRLPLKQLPTEWPVDYHHKQLVDIFSREQWTFCPLEFTLYKLDNRDLPSDLVLPIERLEVIQHGDISKVQKFIINDACNFLVPKVWHIPMALLLVYLPLQA